MASASGSSVSPTRRRVFLHIECLLFFAYCSLDYLCPHILSRVSPNQHSVYSHLHIRRYRLPLDCGQLLCSGRWSRFIGDWPQEVRWCFLLPGWSRGMVRPRSNVMIQLKLICPVQVLDPASTHQGFDCGASARRYVQVLSQDTGGGREVE
jgi:hypothetical protein